MSIGVVFPEPALIRSKRSNNNNASSQSNYRGKEREFATIQYRSINNKVENKKNTIRSCGEAELI